MIKVSGEAFQKEGPCDKDLFLSFAKQLAYLNSEHQLVIVTGGGNFLRGASMKKWSRVIADQMGMIATVINGIGIQNSLTEIGIESCLLCARHIEGIGSGYSVQKALENLEKKKIIICAGGTGNAFFTTDTTAILRACELSCDVILKGTKQDGAYSENPDVCSDAQFLEKSTYEKMLLHKNGIMDLTAFALASIHNIPLVIFRIMPFENIQSLFQNKLPYTLIKED